MGKAYDGKKKWTETILQTTAATASDARRNAKKKRFSGRTVKLSKAMKHVDEETRAIVRNARLDALEADNYGEDEALGEGDDGQDDLYVDDENAPTTQSAKKDRKPRAVTKAKRWKVKSLAQLVYEEHGTGDGTHPSYVSVAAAPSTQPARKFCVVCGYVAPYACRRCGSRYCRVKCGDQHQESGCLKFGL
ncbi:hypothetical protein Poli38472_009310 [Pythium oligandrum]|uniref:HIT-type domain-containing protein n=1 Tax=Pythium oligandrum TaxID=41045 RepID=A0A8K1FP01_PYTOL|nr:hypothetical protein Poli38472_009310 [Pythium oligandrum]|eukprot:TMW65143.1 hypothetical protein Poli38472_009310 [Pythium oligandrum]